MYISLYIILLYLSNYIELAHEGFCLTMQLMTGRLSSLARIVKPPASLRRSFEPSSGPDDDVPVGNWFNYRYIAMMLSIHINNNS